jgi:hypothetical protein
VSALLALFIGSLPGGARQKRRLEAIRTFLHAAFDGEKSEVRFRPWTDSTPPFNPSPEPGDIGVNPDRWDFLPADHVVGVETVEVGQIAHRRSPRRVCWLI